ncbi:MAG TPA: DUF1634 domain-containing protein [Acidobacteriaceae bacterium]|nr:DUF1634 domain-containing protein [Acidobacteriaceae bacterium]
MDDRHLENIIGNLLRAGVLLAATIVLAGGVLFLLQHHAETVHFHTFRLNGEGLRTLSGIVKSAARLDSEGLIQLGLLLLIATPVARVAMAVVGFELERDRLYVVVSMIVLLVLLFSLMHAN